VLAFFIVAWQIKPNVHFVALPSVNGKLMMILWLSIEDMLQIALLFFNYQLETSHSPVIEMSPLFPSLRPHALHVYFPLWVVVAAQIRALDFKMNLALMRYPKEVSHFQQNFWVVIQ
jgi:hypothetical protein